jgi:hypothetical protein
MLTPYEQGVLDAIDGLKKAINDLSIDDTNREYLNVVFPSIGLEQLEQGIWAAVGRRLAEGS